MAIILTNLSWPHSVMNQSEFRGGCLKARENVRAFAAISSSFASHGMKKMARYFKF